ncbi:MAG: hypothetical protein EOO53_01790 [Gammaproteobacteria bacterium]|nr:MAG: hypothetical protein EOO53_01790 [Gammaproteobacteria bacterium]
MKVGVATSPCLAIKRLNDLFYFALNSNKVELISWAMNHLSRQRRALLLRTADAITSCDNEYDFCSLAVGTVKKTLASLANAERRYKSYDFNPRQKRHQALLGLMAKAMLLTAYCFELNPEQIKRLKMSDIETVEVGFVKVMNSDGNPERIEHFKRLLYKTLTEWRRMRATYSGDELFSCLEDQEEQGCWQSRSWDYMYVSKYILLTRSCLSILI